MHVGAEATSAREGQQYSHYISLWRTREASRKPCRYEVA